MSLLEDTAWDPKYRAKMGGFVLVVVGLALAVWGGWGDFKLTFFSKSDPQEITAAQLAKNGPGDNLHVLVTEYRTSSEAVGNSDVAWFIVYPLQRAPGQASLLLKTDGGDSIFGAYVPNDGLQGLVRNGSGNLNYKQRNALKKLGQVDHDNVWIIDHNRKPPPWWSFLLKVFGGLALIGVGLALFLLVGNDD